MKNLILWGSITSLLAACGPSAEEKSKAMQAEADARFAAAMQDSVLTDISPYFISEQHIRGKTKDVQKLVQEMETFTRSHQGYVEQADVNSEVIETKDLRLCKDTMGTYTRYRKVADLKLRIPYFLLDSAKLKALAQVSFIENTGCSNVNAETDYISSTAEQGIYENKLNDATSQIGKKDKSSDLTLQLNQQQESYREKAQLLKQHNLKLQEAVMYATLNLSVVGEEESYLEKQWIMAEIKAYEPGFFEKLFNQLVHGFEGLKNFVLWVSGLWVPLFFTGLGVWLWKRRKTLPLVVQ